VARRHVRGLTMGARWRKLSARANRNARMLRCCRERTRAPAWRDGGTGCLAAHVAATLRASLDTACLYLCMDAMRRDMRQATTTPLCRAFHAHMNTA